MSEKMPHPVDSGDMTKEEWDAHIKAESDRIEKRIIYLKMKKESDEIRELFGEVVG